MKTKKTLFTILLLACIAFTTNSFSQKITGGTTHSLYLCSDSTVMTWGSNTYGELGDGTTIDKWLPIEVGTLSEIIDIAGGTNFSLALKKDGTVWAWGRNSEGELGDGSYTDSYTPIQVNNLTNIIAIAAGGKHSIALKNDGTIWTWGINYTGQLGDGTYTNRNSPVIVSSLSSTTITKISCGVNSTFVLKQDGTVLAWGSNSGGQLGDFTFNNSNIPVQVHGPNNIGFLSNITDISSCCTATHCLALKNDGTLWAWGHNEFGQIGDGTYNDRNTPVQIIPVTGESVTAIAAGGFHSIALLNNNSIWTWGNNEGGQLGDGSFITSPNPVEVTNTFSGSISSISSGGVQSYSITNDGKAWSWGYNLYGNLGDGTNVDKNTPVQVDGLCMLLPILNKKIAAGTYTSFTICNDSATTSWGKNIWGQLGVGTNSDEHLPVNVHGNNNIGFLTEISYISSGYEHTIALKKNGSVYTWGANTYGALGDGTIINKNTPILVNNLSNISSVGSGYCFSAALKNNGTVWMWGNNFFGTLGDGTNIDKSTPIQVHDTNNVGFLRNITSIAVEGQRVLALKNNGTIWAWGFNDRGQLGDGTTINRNIPVQVNQVFTESISKIAVGYESSHAITADSTVWSWGDNVYGQLGTGNLNNYSSSPEEISSLSNIIDVAGGGFHVLALKDDGTVWAWGRNGNGQIGDGSTINRNTPVQVSGLNNIIEISAGYYHSLALRNDSTVWAWGRNANGELGNGTIIESHIPVQVIDLCSGTVNINNFVLKNSNISIYPNPSNGKFTINTEEAKDIESIEVFNVLGEKVFSKKLNQIKSNEIDISNSPKGIYFVKINCKNKVYSEKIVIE